MLQNFSREFLKELTQQDHRQFSEFFSRHSLRNSLKFSSENSSTNYFGYSTRIIFYSKRKSRMFPLQKCLAEFSHIHRFGKMSPLQDSFPYSCYGNSSMSSLVPSEVTLLASPIIILGVPPGLLSRVLSRNLPEVLLRILSSSGNYSNSFLINFKRFLQRFI